MLTLVNLTGYLSSNHFDDQVPNQIYLNSEFQFIYGSAYIYMDIYTLYSFTVTQIS